MCKHCTRANVDCPIYPQETTACTEFLPTRDYAQAWELWLVAQGKAEHRKASLELMRKDVEGVLR
jgi:hypothetical protein